MRISQGYVSKSVSDFSFLETLGLSQYHDSKAPCLFLGCYDDEDIRVIRNHTGMKIIHWMGQDALDALFLGKFHSLMDCYHIAFHPNIQKTFKVLPDCMQGLLTHIDPWTVQGDFPVTPLGEMVYAYVPTSHPVYHRHDIVADLIDELPFKFYVSDGSIPQNEWIAKKCNPVYDQCFIGLALNAYAGAANTIMQLGLKGRMVVTNALETPNCISWSTIDDIKKAIFKEAKLIGRKNPHLSIDVRASFDHLEFLDTDFY